LAIEFTFGPRERLLRRTVQEFMRNEIRPMLKEDKTGHGTFPVEAVKRLQEHGFFGVPIPREYGGAGLGEVGYCILVEELGRMDSSIATIVGAHTGICLTPTWIFGNEEQRERFVRPMADGRALGAFALTEPTAGSDAAGIRTRAEEDGNEYVLNGRKIWCSNGDRAEFILVMAVTDPTLGARGGVTAFMVEKGTPGFEVGSIEDKMGIRSSSTAELIFKDCRVPKENIIGDIGAGLIVALTALDGGRAGLAAGGVGAVKEMLERSLDYAKKRRRSGRPIADHQSVQWRLAEMATDAYLNERAVYEVATLVDRYYHMLARKERPPRELRDEISRKCAMVKVSASEAAGRAVESAMSIFGAAGVRDIWRIEQAFRDQIIIEIFEGTNEIQRMIVARDLVDGGSFW
jgi:alkylation response protein AidB-like acyl-CoA dehydrogenase